MGRRVQEMSTAIVLEQTGAVASCGTRNASEGLGECFVCDMETKFQS